MATIIKLKSITKKDKELTPLQQKLLKEPTMPKKQYEEYVKLDKWMRKWKV